MMPGMSEPQKKAGAGFWATVVVAVALAYPLSYGPFSGLYSRGILPDWLCDAVWPIYWPIDWIYFHGPQPVADAISWWADFWDSRLSGYALMRPK